MKLRLVTGMALALLIAACGEKDTYPISGCDANETFPVTCEEIGDDNRLNDSNAQDLNALPTGA